MKASELISKVSSLMAKHGDLDIFYTCNSPQSANPDLDSNLVKLEEVEPFNDQSTESHVFVIHTHSHKKNFCH